jgi:hypothetical protein
MGMSLHRFLMGARDHLTQQIGKKKKNREQEELPIINSIVVD